MYLSEVMVGLRSALQAFSKDFTIEDDDPTICPACEKKFRSARGMSSHLGTARSCSWYKKGKLKALVMPGQFEDDILSEEINDSIPDELPRRWGAEADPSTVMEDYDDQLFELLPTYEEPHAGPSRTSGAAELEEEEDDEDERVEEEDKAAGASIRVVDTLHERWKRDFGSSKDSEGDVNMSNSQIEEDDKFSPFSSELDWRIARWAIQDGIGHKSFDRLMSIPGVSD